MNYLFTQCAGFNVLLRVFLLVILNACFVVGQAQTGHILTGIVLNNENETLVGVNIMIKGTTQGATTDIEGKFSLAIPETGAVVLFSYIGYKTQEVQVDTQTHLNITLEPDVTQLQDVVVVGFGEVQKKEKIGYAFKDIKGEALSVANEANIVNSMQGRVAGMQTSRSANGVSGSTRIILRGNNSVSGSNQALFVVDGVLIDNADVNSVLDFGNALSNLNTDDFESVTVLKGPAAAALYGSKAANGVIIIRTKRGEATKGIGVSYRTGFMVQKILYGPDFQNVYGSGDPVSGQLGGTPEPSKIELTLGSDGIPYVPFFYGHSWGARMEGQQARAVDGVVRPYSPQPGNFLAAYQDGLQSDHNVTIQGGGEKTTFRGNVGYLNKSGITPGNKMDLLTLNSRVTYDITQKLNIDFGITYGIRNVHNPPFAGLDPRSPGNIFTQQGRDYPFEAILQEKTYRDKVQGGINASLQRNTMFLQILITVVYITTQRQS